jgi:hypothetical protein
MNQLERRLLAIQDAQSAKELGTTPLLYVQHVGFEDLRSQGATEFEHARFTAIIDRINAHAEMLVSTHGEGCLRPHRYRNDAYSALTCDDLEFIEHMIVTYRPTDVDHQAA